MTLALQKQSTRKVFVVPRRSLSSWSSRTLLWRSGPLASLPSWLSRASSTATEVLWNLLFVCLFVCFFLSFFLKVDSAARLRVKCCRDICASGCGPWPRRVCGPLIWLRHLQTCFAPPTRVCWPDSICTRAALPPLP